VKQDPLALAFFGAALAVLAGMLFYVFVVKTPEPASAGRAFNFVERARRQVAAVAEKFQERPAQKAPPAASPKPPPPAVAKSSAPAQTPAQVFHKSVTAAEPSPSAQVPAPLEPGHSWRYRVDVGPPVWRDATLTYRTQREDAGLGVVTDFVHAAGKMNFHLGIYAAGHPSHANTRFPGFFMYAAYLKPPFTVGKPVVIAWPWQGGGGKGAGPGRMKRFEGTVTGWEDIQVEAGKFRAAKIDGWLRYMEADGNQYTRVAMLFWFAPSLGQVVKVFLEGNAPDENLNLIVAELVEFR
jgi:hypothetical protein